MKNVVPNRVLDQVRDEPGEQTPISHDRGGRKRDVEVQVLGERLDFVRAQRIARHHGEVDRLATPQPLLPLGEREEGIDQLLLLL